MALLNKFTNDSTWLTVDNAYYKARKNISIVWECMYFSCDIFASQEARQQMKSTIASIEYAFPIIDTPADEDERAAVLYGLLKTLPNFKNSVDI